MTASVGLVNLRPKRVPRTAHLPDRRGQLLACLMLRFFIFFFFFSGRRPGRKPMLSVDGPSIKTIHTMHLCCVFFSLLAWGHWRFVAFFIRFCALLDPPPFFFFFFFFFCAFPVVRPLSAGSVCGAFFFFSPSLILPDLRLGEPARFDAQFQSSGVSSSAAAARFSSSR